MFVDKQHHGSPRWSSHGRLHQDRTANSSTSCHGIPRARGTAQSRLLVFWTSVANRHVSWASFITKVHGGYTIQTDTETLLAGLRDLNQEHCKPSKLLGATRCYTVGAIRTQVVPSSGGSILPLQETLISRSVSCAVMFNHQQWVTCRHCGNLHVTSKGLHYKLNIRLATHNR